MGIGRAARRIVCKLQEVLREDMRFPSRRRFIRNLVFASPRPRYDVKFHTRARGSNLKNLSSLLIEVSLLLCVDTNGSLRSVISV